MTENPFSFKGGIVILKLPKPIQDILNKCQSINQTVIVGGYIRNTLLGYDFKDVDLLTCSSPEELKNLFPSLTWTDTSLNFGITRLSYSGIHFDFVSCDKNEFTNKLADRDFTINSFYYDGKTLTAPLSSTDDLQKRRLHPMPNFETRDQLAPTLIRAFRFTSLYDLHWSEQLLETMNKTKSFYSDIPEGRLQSEAYEILLGENVLRSLYYYAEIGLINQNPKLKELSDISIPLYNPNLTARLTYLCYLVGTEPIYEWLQLHNLSHKHIEQVASYLPYLDMNPADIPPSKFNLITLIKRYQFQDDKESIKNFILQKQRKK